MRNLRKYWTYIAIETMRELMHTTNNWKNKSESQTLNNIPFDILLSDTSRENIQTMFNKYQGLISYVNNYFENSRESQ